MKLPSEIIWNNIVRSTVEQTLNGMLDAEAGVNDTTPRNVSIMHRKKSRPLTRKNQQPVCFCPRLGSTPKR